MENRKHLQVASVVESVQLQALTNPRAIAVVDGHRRLDYSELDARANQMAGLLSERKVGPGVLVGLCMRRSQEFIIAALAILKTGAAYLPIDPDYPGNRISAVLSDAGAPIVLAHSNSAQQLQAGDWTALVLDAAGMAAGHYPRTAPEVAVACGDLAYVIFTSGSTGQPKGVEITHSNLMNLVEWHLRAFSVLPTDRATFQASPGFDAAVWEIWPYLAAGACVYVVDDRKRTDPQALRDWIVENAITISFLPTALAEQMLQLSWPSEAKLRFLLTGADTLRKRPPAGLPFKLVNNYGPTEATVVTTSGLVEPGDSSNQPSIGKPIDNVKVYIVDEKIRQVPFGTAGELLIGGTNVARGYLGRREQTADKFISDPFSPGENARLYRTGDLVRQLPNGELAFLGRIDEQIKIRGHRVEPGEVITALNRHASVAGSFVMARTAESGEKRLVAYVVATQDALLNATSLRRHLSAYLPDYMIPAAFVQVERLPVSLNGKVDHSALPDPGVENLIQEENFEAPQSELQERLTGIVADLLGVEKVGLDDNFFNLGGHSLLGAQMIARIRQMFGVELSLLDLFQDPTVRGMSSEIERLFVVKLESMSEDEAQRLLATQDSD